MGTPKTLTRWCDTCEHLDYTYPRSPCTRGHSPRYYQPKNARSPFGYKRVCEDFDEAILQPVRVLWASVFGSNR